MVALHLASSGGHEIGVWNWVATPAGWVPKAQEAPHTIHALSEMREAQEELPVASRPTPVGWATHSSLLISPDKFVHPSACFPTHPSLQSKSSCFHRETGRRPQWRPVSA